MDISKRTPNNLVNEASPYLLQHAYNPVDWYPWGDTAFEKAKREDKPVFLSIGYSTCHWCHVMAHESFEDETVAALLNRDFVSVKVDREERPDVDAVYMAVCQALTGSGGWPLTVLLAPDKKPFFAGTYFPKETLHGRTGLVELLKSAVDVWKNERAHLENTSRLIVEAMQKAPQETREPEKKLIERAYALYKGNFDARMGGFGREPKFPTPHNLLFLMRYSEIEKAPEALKMATFTLDRMAEGGIFDHIGGGFSRYSTDAKWLVPHFEKMLYDNALLILAYTDAWQLTQKPLYADTVRRTADYILRELTDERGGFYCGQDADSDGVEGKYYVFTPDEVRGVLGEADGNEFCRVYSITEKGNFEGRSIPNRIGASEDAWAFDDIRLKKLYEYRRARAKLHKDDKVLLSWNAWTVAALAKAGFVFGETKYLNAAINAHEFIQNNMTDDEGRLFLRWRDGQAAHAGQLDDYAVYAMALLTLYKVTFNPAYLEKAVQTARQMRTFFEDAESGGYFIYAHDAEKLIARPKETYDGAMPSGNSVVAYVLQELSDLTAESEWTDAAKRQTAFVAGAVAEYPVGHSFAILALTKALYPPKTLVVTSAQGIPKELTLCTKQNPSDGLCILLKTDKNARLLAECAPFT